MRRFRTYPQIGGKRGGIPSGWVEVEYIESTGPQWIDTGVVTSYSTHSKDLIKIETRAVRPIGGLWHDGSAGYSDWINYRDKGDSGYAYTYYYGSGPLSFDVPQDELFHNWVFDFGTTTNILCDGVLVASRSTVSASNANTRPFPLMAIIAHTGSVKVSQPNKCGPTKIFINGVMVRDYVGVRNATTNEVAMCDILTGDIYRNAGTGAFIAGPDKGRKTARDYVQDGLIRSLNAVENAGFGVHDSNATVWTDLSGSGNDLTVYANATRWEADALVGIYRNYASSQYARPMATWKTLTNRRYIELVLKVDQYDQDQASRRAIVFAGGSTERSILFCDGYLQGYYDNNGCINTNITDRHSYAFAYDDSNVGAGKYLDGVLNLGTNTRRSVTLSSIRLGCGYWTNTNNAMPFIGEIMAIREYDRHLSDAEREINYKVDKEMFGIA